MEKANTKKKIKAEIPLTESVEAVAEGRTIVVKGSKGEVKRALDGKTKVNIENGKVILSTDKHGRR